MESLMNMFDFNIYGDPSMNIDVGAQDNMISGYVKTSGAIGINGVNMTFSNNGGSTTTNNDGYYNKVVSYGWSGTVTPSKEDYIFDPPSRSYTNVTSDQSGEDYTGSLLTEAVDNLISYVKTIIADYNLLSFQGDRLTKPLNKAMLNINNKQYKKAIKNLKQFERVVMSLSRGGRSPLPPEVADTLVAKADQIIAHLSPSLIPK